VIGYVAIKLPPEVKRELLSKFPFGYANTFGDHITLAFGVRHSEFAPLEHNVTVTGFYRSAACEVFSATVDGKDTRELENKAYHITWSLDPVYGLGAKHSVEHIQSRNKVKDLNIKFSAPSVFIPFK
jgi:hypothetical protein